jgi:hypothetical protein
VVTVWWCESCNAKGTVTMAADAGVYEGFQRVWEAHTVTEPSCKGGRDTVRVQIDNEDRCGRLMVGSGPDTYDPVCELPIGHEPPCKSSTGCKRPVWKDNLCSACWRLLRAFGRI